MTKIYKPSKKEKFMNPQMKKYFKNKLTDWKKSLLKESSNTINNLQNEESLSKPDFTDRASEEIERSDFFTPGKSKLNSNDLSVSAISAFGVNSFLKLLLKNSESLKKSSNIFSFQKDYK